MLHSAKQCEHFLLQNATKMSHAPKKLNSVHKHYSSSHVVRFPKEPMIPGRRKAKASHASYLCHAILSTTTTTLARFYLELDPKHVLFVETEHVLFVETDPCFPDFLAIKMAVNTCTAVGRGRTDGLADTRLECVEF